MATSDTFDSVRTISRRSVIRIIAGGSLIPFFPREGYSGTNSSPISGRAAAAEFQRAAERAEICSASNVAGVGLRGEYFASTDRRAPPLLSRIDGPVDLPPDLDWPPELKGRSPGFVRWSGWVKPVVAGRYRFHADALGSSVTVARVVVAGIGAPPDATVDMAAGRFYPITLEWSGPRPAAGRVRLEWTAPYGARFVVPRTLLYLPTESVVKN